MKSDGLDLIGNSIVTRELIDRRGPSFPENPSNADLFQLTETVGEKEPGIYMYSQTSTDWIEQTDEESNPYDIGLSVIGRPKPSDMVAMHIAVRTGSIYKNFDRSLAVATDAASDQTVFQVNMIDEDGNVLRPLGTVTFEAAGKRGIFTAETADEDMIFQKGDIISVKAPEIRDATLKNISITIAGQMATITD